ncbi:MAG: putative D-methionine transport system permease protein MetI [marine bacterium B5-7]|nr:MAG: putative D-methionine transport system permease protein MetI [marine bacterium B5-7]
MSIDMSLLLNATGETLLMVGVSGIVSSLLGLLLGIVLYLSRDKGLGACYWLYRGLDIFVNMTRSIPFIILLILLLPITRWLVGTSIGTAAATVPLSLGAIPFVARLMETALLEVPVELIDAGLAMGGTVKQILWHIILPEALSTIIQNVTVTFVTLVSFSAMAGVVGGGGLGDVAIRYGYQRFDQMVMLETVVILIVLVQCIQWAGDACVRRWGKKS